MKIAVIYLLLALAISGFLAYAGPLASFWQLSEHAAVAAGSVVRQSCEDHNTVQYEFSVAGKTYAGRDQPLKACNAVRSGEQVDVYYLITQPTTNTLEIPSQALKNEFESIGTAAVLAPAAIIWAYRRRRRENAA